MESTQSTSPDSAVQDKPQGRRPNWKNRQIIVNSKVQSVFIGYGIAMGFLFLSLGLVLSTYFERILMIQANVGESLTGLDIIIFAVIVVLILFVIFLGMIVSNRVVGPIFKLVLEMELLDKTGELNDLHFRKNDYFQDVAVSYNKIIGRIRELESKVPKS
jgi:hypothetical protein